MSLMCPGPCETAPKQCRTTAKMVAKKKKYQIKCERAKDQKLEAEPNLWPGSDNRIDDSICRPHDTTEKTRKWEHFRK